MMIEVGKASKGALMVVVLATCACSSLDNCPDARDPILVPNQEGMTDVAALSYESAPWNGPLQEFPAKSAVWFEHGLGVTPRDAIPYLSFSKDGTHDGEHGSVATSAGNQSLIDCMDSRVIVLRNDTCERSFFVRVTAFGQGTDRHEECGQLP